MAVMGLRAGRSSAQLAAAGRTLIIFGFVIIASLLSRKSRSPVRRGSNPAPKGPGISQPADADREE
eukprot:7346722-Pyramimonas_sp.AAC.1